MTYKQLKDMTLMLINQYSVAGELVAPSYNNQQDYISKIVPLANDAITEIALGAKKILATAHLDDCERTGGVYKMPSDFYQYKSGDIVSEAGEILPTGAYRMRGDTVLLMPEQPGVTVGYWRYPRLLPDRPADDTELDNAPETHSAVAFYVAAHLVMQDDQFAYASLYNKYEDKLSKMQDNVYIEIQDIDMGTGMPWGCVY